MRHSKILAAEAAAREARKGFLKELPVPLEKVARKYGIKVETTYLDDDLSGMAFKKGDLSVIVVNGNHHPHRRRFTLAHEIGHHLLHSGYLKSNVHVDKAVLNRDSKSAKGSDYKEIEANAFAAELLMPERELKSLARLDINNDLAVQKAAKRLKVSVSALTYRLANLDLR